MRCHVAWQKVGDVANDPAALLFCTEDGGSRFLQNVGTYLSRYNASHPRRQ